MDAGKGEKMAAFALEEETATSPLPLFNGSWRNLDRELVCMSIFIISQVEKLYSQGFNISKRYVRQNHA